MAQDYSGYQFVSKGDYAMNHMDLLTGWVDISIYDGVTSPDYRVFVLNDESSFSKKYYLYFLQYCYSKQIFYSLAQGVSEFGRCRLKADKFLHYDVLYPPYKEQCEIAEYLDEKTGIVDNNISKIEATIDILKKYRNTIIYDYATGKKEVPQE
jgi:type I restriction enzyme S subunit